MIFRQGTWIGRGSSGIAIIFATFGNIPPAVGAILQQGIDVRVIFNALRIGNISGKELVLKKSSTRDYFYPICHIKIPYLNHFLFPTNILHTVLSMIVGI
jgi:hypothetical protein